ncbi:hypothetical protein K2173_013164 [Erythroxylum novogranatense]|uniref:N-acetyltransferase domain-containing protein n=1 Tax=Erythroxylum novogranatense TaxID=1862640 RepID=A0AAV8S6B3_9ROSI|nr:hypothetical protein K2173_013164 [Erythroxylum novogranatense]
MANFLPSYLHVSNGVRLEASCICKGARVYFSSSYGRKFSGKKRNEGKRRQEACIVQCCSTSSTPSSSQSFPISAEAKHVLAEERSLEAKEARGLDLENLMSEFGWRVRRLAHNDQHEIREAVEIQAEAFHTPMFLFDDWFFQFFKAEVLSGLVYKLRNSPLNRYACLVAEPVSDSYKTQRRLVGVVDVTALRDEDVLKHLRGEEEYLYVSGIAVSKNFRRRKIASILLEACEMLSILWHFEYLALRAYEDDFGARKLYANAGYKVVSSDPQWMAWTGRRRRVLMIKKSGLSM